MVLALLAPLACRELTQPVESAVELRLRRIYDAREWLRRVPVELATSLVAPGLVERFLDDLELPEPLERRLLERVHARDFVDELVPFLLFLRDMYVEPEGESAETFDDHVRARFRPDEAIPGMVHDMFSWQVESEERAGLPTLPPEVVRELLAFYDVLYLQGQTGAAHVGERLACETRTLELGLEEATRAAAPAIRGLLRALGDTLADQAEVAAAVRAVLDDDSRLDAATAALIRFVDQTVCRNYRFFAARAFRIRQLQGWLEEQLDSPGGGDLWEWLDRSLHRRRYGVAIVVDGLQGRLVEALARGQASDVFIRRIVSEQDAAGGPRPSGRSWRAAPEQRVRFLEALGRRGFQHPHYLPFFRRMLAAPGTRWLPVGVSTTPTISVRNIPIALSGAPVAGEGATGLPNFHFVDRSFRKDGEPRGRAYYFFGSDAVELVSMADQAGMRSLFERLPQQSSLSCTAQYDERAQFGIDALLNLGLGERLRDFGDRLCAAELWRRARSEREVAALKRRLLERRDSLGQQVPWYRFWEQLGGLPDRGLAQSWIRQIAEKEQRSLPELLVVYNPWPDHFAHFEGPFADEILAPSGELNRLDYWLGRWTRAYEEAGVLDRTLFGMAGDHGLAPVFHLLNPEVEVFDALREEGLDFRVVKISSDEGEGPKLTNPFDPPSMKGIDVVVASTAGGNYMLDLFADQREGFTRQPVAGELRDLRPIAAPDGKGIDLLEEIALRLSDSLDYLVVREVPCGPDGGVVRLIGRRDSERGEAVIRREGERLHYASTGVDLLGLDQLSPYERFDESAEQSHARLRARCLETPVEDPSAWCHEAEWRDLTSFTARPDSVVQLGHLYDTPRAGTINLFPRTGVGYNSVVPGRHAGESFHEKNAFVAIWGQPLARAAGRSALRSAVNGSMPMAIYEHLSGERPIRGTEGWGYDPLPEDWFQGAVSP
ncbi:MAG: nucleotide pyrophosphatase [Deltaproteobacteria bacterium]|nr:nucleotide pyrophosphatase [Deltaproteobacteria bacterium]